MGWRLKILTILAIASLFTRCLRTQETNSDLSLRPHTLEIRGSERLPTCGYSASRVWESRGTPSSKQVNQYVVTLDLTGKGWRTVCRSFVVMVSTWHSIKSRCEAEWERMGLERRFLDDAEIVFEKGTCRMQITVRADPLHDPGYPTCEDACIWDRKPDLSSCVPHPTIFPWPSGCRARDVGL